MNTQTIDRILILVGLMLATAFGIIYMSQNTALGSVEYAGAAYQSTTTRTAVLGAALSSPKVLATGTGLFGSLVITGADTGIINFYDGTTTGVHSDRATTTLATFPASAGAGTYVFDVEYKLGLIVEITGSAPTSTITWKR